MRMDFIADNLTTFDELKNFAEMGHLNILEKVKLAEGWDVFLSHLFESHQKVRHYQIEWLQKNIPEILLADPKPFRRFGSKLMDWYILNSSGAEAIQAVGFAINLYEARRLEDIDSDFGEKIFRKLRETKHAYWEIPTVDWFVRENLAKVSFVRSRCHQYGQLDWASAERAINAIIDAQDVTMLAFLQEILDDHKTDNIGFVTTADNGTRIRFERARILATIEETVRLLTEIKKQQQPSLTELVGKPLAEMAKLSAPVLFQVRYPERIPDAEGKSRAVVTVELDCENHADTLLLRNFLRTQRHRFEIFPTWHRCETPPRFRSDVDPETLTLVNVFVPKPETMARFSLAFSFDRKTLAVYHGYIKAA